MRRIQYQSETLPPSPSYYRSAWYQVSFICRINISNVSLFPHCEARRKRNKIWFPKTSAKNPEPNVLIIECLGRIGMDVKKKGNNRRKNKQKKDEESRRKNKKE